MLRTVLLQLMMAVGGCSGMTYAMSTYTGVSLVKVTAKYNVWKILDKSKEGWLIITPSISGSIAALEFVVT